MSLWKGPFSHYTRPFLLTPESSLELSVGLITPWKETLRKVSRDMTLPTCEREAGTKSLLLAPASCCRWL